MLTTPPTWNTRGVTLMEIIVAGVAATVVAVGLTAMDANRARMQQVARGGLANDADTLLAAHHIGLNLTRADRLVLRDSGNAILTPSGRLGEGNLQVRYPACPADPADPSCFDLEANYRWGEYWLHDRVLRYFSDTQSGCSSSVVLADHVLALRFEYPDNAAFSDQALEPFPGGRDNNTIEYRLLWSVGNSTHEFRSQITSRAAPYSNVQAIAQNDTLETTQWDSGLGLSPAGIANPPARCGGP